MTEIEKGYFIKLFNRHGYVLDFSTNGFDVFTKSSIGIALCDKYKLSKGRSLEAFCEDASLIDVEKLLFDLLEYYEINCKDMRGEDRYFAIYKKCKNVKDKNFARVMVELPAIKCVNREYILDVSIRAIQDLEDSRFDSAITKSRTLVEEVFCYAIEEKGKEPSNKGDINKLYRQVKDLYNMHQNKNIDNRINSLLSGLEKILNAISQMRNESSDAHGVGKRRININEYHARLFVNSAMTIADFILSVVKNTKQ